MEEKIFNMNIKELAKEFTSKPGNSIVSDQMLIDFFKFIQSKGIVYDMLADKLGLVETNKKGFWRIKGSQDRIEFILNSFGFQEVL